MQVDWVRKLVNQLILIKFLIFGLVSSCEKTSNVSLINNNQNRSSTEIIVSAAASMQDALKAIKFLYIQKYPQTKITFNFGSSGSLQHQIEQGAPIDIFISAAPQQMNSLAEKKLLLSESRQNLLKNQMVLVVPKNSYVINDFNDLTSNSIEQIALGEPRSVPAGLYAQEILTSLGLIDDIQPKAVYGKDVRQVLSYVASGNIEAGIVYRSDAAIAKQVKVVATAPRRTHSPVVYPVAIVKDSKHPQVAQQMLQFFFSPEAQEIFQQHGFLPIADQSRISSTFQQLTDN